jgi:hypothetical protein
MVELIKDTVAEDSKRSTDVIDKANSARDLAKSVREEKKREAIERSQRRQADPEYFERILTQNTLSVQSTTGPVQDDTSQKEIEQDCDEIDNDQHKDRIFDPFRPAYAGKEKRNKISVR